MLRPWWLPDWVSLQRRPTTGEGWFLLVIEVLIVLSGLNWAVRELLQHWYLIPPVALMTIFTVRVYLSARRSMLAARAARLAQFGMTIEEIDDLDDSSFEFAVRDLMIRDGIDAERVGGKDDQGRDVFGRDGGGRMWVVQCKHTIVESNVGVNVVYVVNGTAWQFHDADEVLIVTNGGFTSSAIRCAAQAGIHLIDRRDLTLWAEERHNLLDILGLTSADDTRDQAS